MVLAENDPLSKQINRKVKEIDSNLFLEKQIRLPDQRPCWYVMHGGSLDGEPIALFEWSDPEGTPLELSWSIIDRLIAGRLDRTPNAVLAGAAAKAANDAKYEEMNARSLADHEEAALDIRLLHPGHSALLPRGVKLRMSRDKRRARGEKV